MVAKRGVEPQSTLLFVLLASYISHLNAQKLRAACIVIVSPGSSRQLNRLKTTFQSAQLMS